MAADGVYIFVGPTLRPDEVRAELDAVCLPPVAQGDVYRVALRRPAAIGIIDGYFERVPAVWHKEILWAMHEGVHVFGSASMGALRAAELDAFGMEGTGWIFEAFRDGVLDADDEVAVAHGPPESGYQPSSEALVNIRRTLAAAESAAVISGETRSTLEAVARAVFYADRTYPLLIERAAEAGAPPEECAALRDWLPRGRVDQKREDALAMLRLIRERLAAGLAPKQVRFSFEHTDIWEEARSLGGTLLDGAGGVDGHLPLDALLDELRLTGENGRLTLDLVMARVLAADEARRHRLQVNPRQAEETAERFRRARGLLHPEAMQRWLDENHLDAADFARLMEDETRLGWVRQLTASEVLDRLPDHLRVAGDYPHLLRRAREKRRLLGGRGLENAGLEDTGLTRDQIVDWYFRRLGVPVPDDLDRYARDGGWADEATFLRGLVLEYCFLAEEQPR